MKKTNLFFISFLIIFILFLGCGRGSSKDRYSKKEFKHPHKDRFGHFHEFDHSRIDKMAEKLDLSAEQVESLKELEKEIIEKQFEIRKEKKHRDLTKKKIVEMIKKDSLSKEEIIAFMEEVHFMEEKLRKETDSFVAERLVKMHSILSEEQRKELAKKLEEFEPGARFKKKEDKR